MNLNGIKRWKWTFATPSEKAHWALDNASMVTSKCKTMPKPSLQIWKNNYYPKSKQARRKSSGQENAESLLGRICAVLNRVVALLCAISGSPSKYKQGRGDVNRDGIVQWCIQGAFVYPWFSFRTEKLVTDLNKERYLETLHGFF